MNSLTLILSDAEFSFDAVAIATVNRKLLPFNLICPFKTEIFSEIPLPCVIIWAFLSCPKRSCVSTQVQMNMNPGPLVFTALDVNNKTRKSKKTNGPIQNGCYKF